MSKAATQLSKAEPASPLRGLAESFSSGHSFEFAGFPDTASTPEWASLLASGGGPWLWSFERGQFLISARFLRVLGHEVLHDWESETEFVDRIHVDDRAKFESCLRDHLAGRWPLLIQLRLHSAHGDLRHFRLSGRRLQDSENQDLDAVAGCIEDVTERTRIAHELSASKEELRENLERTQRMQNQLLRSSRTAGMADVASHLLHGIGNTVNSLSVQVECALDRWHHDDAQALKRLASMLTGDGDLAQHLHSHPRGKLLAEFVATLSERSHLHQADQLDVLQQMHECCLGLAAELQAQRTFAGPSNLISEIRIRDVVVLALEGYDVDLRAMSIATQIQASDELTIHSDPDKVRHILARLIENAIAALRQGPRHEEGGTELIVSANPTDDGGCRVQVRDFGCGVPNTIEIFRMGWSTRPGSRGLGLHMAGITAQSLHGSLAAEGPDTVERGSCFTLRLPSNRPPQQQQQQTDRASEGE